SSRFDCRLQLAMGQLAMGQLAVCIGSMAARWEHGSRNPNVRSHCQRPTQSVFLSILIVVEEIVPHFL
ncbi:MAG: hypothetical protein MUD01_16270, partial [Chloroflexaceae bacterium]|nr:hypothetical protein [Chloroflexaceae bacterium]